MYLPSESKTARPDSGDAGGYGVASGQIVARVLVQVLLLGALMTGLGWLVTHSLVHVWPFSAEDAVDRTLAAHRDSAVDNVTSALSTVADTTCTILLAVAAIIVTWRVSGRRRAAAFIALALATEVSVFLVTTALVHRARPGVVELDHSPPTSSFPSGHTAAAVVLYGAVAWLIARATGRWQAWLLLLVPMAVAFARLYRGMHHPSDVVAGFLLGACCLVIAARAVLRGRR